MEFIDGFELASLSKLLFGVPRLQSHYIIECTRICSCKYSQQTPPIDKPCSFEVEINHSLIDWFGLEERDRTSV